MDKDLKFFLFPFLMGRFGSVGKHVRNSDSIQFNKCDRIFFVSKQTVGLSTRFVQTSTKYAIAKTPQSTLLVCFWVSNLFLL